MSLAFIATLLVMIVIRVHAADTLAFNSDFETDTSGWGGSGTVVRTASGTDGIMSAGGAHHAIITGSPAGPNTQLGGYGSTWPGEWKTSIDIYLDPAWSAGSGFVYSVATNNTSGVGLRDFVFQAGVLNDESTGDTDAFVALADTSGPSTSDPLGHIKDMPADRRAEIAAADWYTIEHDFRNVDGRLVVTVSLFDSSHALIKSWPLDYEWMNDLIPSQVGGNRYGWFVNVSVLNGLAIDNVTRSVTNNTYSIENESTTPADVTLDEGQTVALLGTSNGNVTTPVQVTITGSSNNVQVVIPAGTEITANDTSWSGVLDAPSSHPTDTITAPNQSILATAAFKVGSTTPLTFSRPVKVILPGQAGKKAGYLDHGNAFHDIPTACDSDPATTLVGSIKECYVTDGDDLVIWTTHFTVFFAYTNIPGAPDTGLHAQINIGWIIGIVTGTVVLISALIVAPKRQARVITINRR